ALLLVWHVGPPLAPAIPLPSIEPGGSVLLAVGDIGSCDGTDDDAVADLAARLPGTIALLGDIVYPDGSSADYADCFDPAWGSLRARIRPALGNHDYQTTDASGYFSYFGAAAGTPGAGWYSYGLGTWHVIVLNSNCDAVGGCGPGSPQLAWLEADLAASGAASPAACTLAYWHHPRYSSGRHGDDDRTDALWTALATAGADLVLTGHDHDYERLALADGIRSFVVGTGGRSLYELTRPAGPHTELRADDSYGLLMLTLGESAYEWRFVPAPGSSLVDAGSGTCH
ncbi:MAG: metallophosphoesterase, partial [Chloroflexota bacterium]|nr:metallophosphoesterase [Chloroflexota bacterium]